MSGEKSGIEAVEDKIKKAAKEVEDFADKVTADEEPNVVVNEREIGSADKPRKEM